MYKLVLYIQKYHIQDSVICQLGYIWSWILFLSSVYGESVFT